MKDKPLRTVDDIIAENEGKTLEEIMSKPLGRHHLISVDELRAAGALDCPPELRRSLSAGNKRSRGKSADDMPLFADLAQTSEGDAESADGSE